MISWKPLHLSAKAEDDWVLEEEEAEYHETKKKYDKYDFDLMTIL